MKVVPKPIEEAAPAGNEAASAPAAPAATH
jgi:hypothetical protein